MKQTKTLAQVANDIENGNNLHEYTNQDGATIKAGNFETFADFLTYYDLHYLPLLRAIRNGEDITPERRHLLNFMADDLIKMFHQDEDTDTEDTDTAPVIEAEDITDTADTDTEDTPAEFFTPGTRYRCTKSVKDAFTAGRIYEQRDEPTAHYAWFTNDKGNRHAWPQPAEIAHELEIWDDLTADDIDPRNYFEPVSE